ncbi:helix-turn-helix transcriptional regulator [Streptomyces prunicolor]|uniref:helix-turn-helix domain-containing protein n=1 Tax=Streptomyces prunicolor TaxID=67348 RepID=UPI0022557F67|nr:helix-turn-helix transcriptional regulator [Streptomyces prunicolor]MCX5235141.1 helix-turn-helix transcriptional regulator [Streptomyces prunicolor]
MSRHSITERHMRAMLDVIDEARHSTTDEVPPLSLLEGLGRLIPCDLAEFSEVDLPTRSPLGDQAVEYGGHYPLVDDEAWWRFKHQHPHCVAVERSHGDLAVSQLSDHLPTREFRNLALFSEYMRPFTTMYDIYREAARRRQTPVRLTLRELDVMRAVAKGLSNGAIAGQLVVEPSTVRKHLENVYRKLGVSSRTAAVARLFPETS